MTPRTGLGVSLYRRLMRLYPARFRARFGEEMVQLFADQLREARNAGTPGASLKTWLRTLGDLAVTVASEHAVRNPTMNHVTGPPSPVSRALGIAGILGGLLLLLGFFMEMGSILTSLRIIVFNLGAVAIILAVYWRLRLDIPRLALVAAVPAIVANAVFIGWELLAAGSTNAAGGAFGLFGDLAGISMWWTDAFFGLVALRLPGIGRWGAAALAFGSAVAPAGLDRLGWISPGDGSILGASVLVAIALAGIGWIILGLDIATQRVTSTRHGTSAAASVST